jgi:hypothetical protein
MSASREFGKLLGKGAFGIGKFAVKGIALPVVVAAGEFGMGLLGDTVVEAVTTQVSKLRSLEDGERYGIVINDKAVVIIPSLKGGKVATAKAIEDVKEHFKATAEESFAGLSLKTRILSAEEVEEIKANRAIKVELIEEGLIQACPANCDHVDSACAHHDDERDGTCPHSI